MGKHEAPVPPKVERIHWFVRLCTHHGMHLAGVVTLHIVAFVVATPILVGMGIGGGGH